MIQFLQANDKGRDFVIGDIHGCFDELMLLLKSVNFDHSKDRLICTGDLVDRGPKNIEVLEFFDKHYGTSVFSVKGNHDEMFEMKVMNMIDNSYEHAQSICRQTLHRNDTGWINDYIRQKKNDEHGELISDMTPEWNNLKRWATRFKEMPYVLIVGKDTPSRYNVVHTEFIRTHPNPRKIWSWNWGYSGMLPDPLQPYRGKVTDLMIENWDLHDYKTGAIYGMYNEAFTWKRDIFNTPINGHQQKPKYMSLTYSGHNALRTGIPVKIQQQIILDTSAGYIYRTDGEERTGYALSMIEHVNDTPYGTVHRVNGDMQYSTTNVDLTWIDKFHKEMMVAYKKRLSKRNEQNTAIPQKVQNENAEIDTPNTGTINVTTDLDF